MPASNAREPTILGVVNLSPESNVPGSHAGNLEAVLNRSRKLKRQGADIIELGARSISADRSKINDTIEMKRLEDPLTVLIEEGYKVAVDTWSNQTALFALEKRVDFINFTGSHPSEEVFKKVAEYNARICLLYLPYTNPYTMRESNLVTYDGSLIIEYFQKILEKLTGFHTHQIILDPNLGIFHPDLKIQMKIALQIQAIQCINSLSTLGNPILAYLARKKEYTSRLLIAAQLATTKIDYIRTHEPRIFRQAWIEKTKIYNNNSING